MAATTLPVSDTLLRRALQANAAFSAVSGAVLIAGAGPLGAASGLPAIALTIMGAILIPYGLFIAYAATRPAIDRRVAWAAIVLDALWVIDSLIILATGWAPLTPAGWWAVLILALVVAIFAEVQYLGLRRNSMRNGIRAG
jgi:hypothetical protein